MNKPKWLRQAAVGASAAIIMTALTSYMEGIRLTPYRDVGGTPTVCEGLTEVPMHNYSREECSVLDSLRRKRELSLINNSVTVPLTQAQQAAFADFAYNVGDSAWLNSTARRLVNNGDIKGGCAQLLRWVWAGSRKQAGLIYRRKAEYQLCIGDFHGTD